MSGVSVLAFQSTIDLGDRIAPLIARIDRRARRLIVKVDLVSGCVIVTAPSKRSLPEALDFARTRARWIGGQLDNSCGAKPFRPGLVFPLRGNATSVVNEGGPRSAVRLAGARLIAGGEPAHLNRRITDWLKKEARCALTKRVEHYAATLGRSRGEISIRDTRSRWGSCARNGSMSFSWRLILAPPPMLDYVAAHECAHLVHLNHSPRFWRVVRELGVDAGAARDWFAAHGRALYAYGVEHSP